MLELAAERAPGGTVHPSFGCCSGGKSVNFEMSVYFRMAGFWDDRRI
jgi:hypothetical protein